MPVASLEVIMSLTPSPAPQTCSASAPRLASLSTRTDRPRASLIARAASTPTQPGRIEVDPTVPVSAWIGPGGPSRRPAHSRGRRPSRPARRRRGRWPLRCPARRDGRSAALGASRRGRYGRDLPQPPSRGSCRSRRRRRRLRGGRGRRGGWSPAPGTRGGGVVDALGDEAVADEVGDQRGDGGAR